MQLSSPPATRSSWVGPDSYFDWLDSCKTHNKEAGFDVVLITHPRDEDDLPRMFPWSKHLERHERASLTKHLKPALGEAIETEALRVGILFLPLYAKDMIHPSTRAASRKVLEEGLKMAHQVGARLVCLGGLTGALSLYGRKLAPLATELGIVLTTGHAVTAISVFETYRRTLTDLEIDPTDSTMVVLGAGSVGGAFARLMLQQSRCPKKLVLVDKPSRQEHLISVCQSLQEYTSKTEISFELTESSGELLPDSICYDCTFLVTAVSTANVVDINRVAPRTVLIDDSQPYCWDREQAWQRCRTDHDIIPCEAGLIDCSNIGYRSRFPFDFAEQDQYGASSTSWSCLAEGLLLALQSDLPTTIGEPSIESILKYHKAFQHYEFGAATLQCGQNKLPIQTLKKMFV